VVLGTFRRPRRPVGKTKPGATERPVNNALLCGSDSKSVQHGFPSLGSPHVTKQPVGWRGRGADPLRRPTPYPRGLCSRSAGQPRVLASHKQCPRTRQLFRLGAAWQGSHCFYVPANCVSRPVSGGLALSGNALRRHSNRGPRALAPLNRGCLRRRLQRRETFGKQSL
jgi:hypothetical protein